METRSVARKQGERSAAGTGPVGRDGGRPAVERASERPGGKAPAAKPGEPGPDTPHGAGPEPVPVAPGEATPGRTPPASTQIDPTPSGRAEPDGAGTDSDEPHRDEPDRATPDRANADSPDPAARGTAAAHPATSQAGASARPGWRRHTRWIGPGLAAGLILLSVLILREITHEITWADLRRAIRAVPPLQILASLALAAGAMVTMALYDVLSCRIAGLKTVPARLAGTAGFCGYALSNTLGFHVILGGTVRYRIYARHGLSAQQIAQVLALSIGTIWLSVAALGALVFLFEPRAVPLLRWAPHVTQGVGLAVAAALAALIWWLWPGRGAIRLFGWHFPLPDGRGAIAQMLLGMLDYALAAGALYVLLPGDLRPEFAAFMLIFITAFLAGALSHAPGGLGVLEAGILLALGAANRPDAVAALLVFRLTYYILPFCLAVLALAGMELLGRGRPWRTLWRYSAIAAAFGLATVLLLILTRKG